MSKLTHWFLFSVILYCIAEKISYLSVERPMVAYCDPKFVQNATITSRRFGRQNPIHYLTLNFTILEYVGNNVTISWYIYEFLSNTYKRGFFEYHYRICDFLEKDKIVGAMIKRRLNGTSCPLPPGQYTIANLTVPPARIPKNVPFKKGRLFLNFTFTNSKVLLAGAYTDLEIKEIKSDKLRPDFFL